MTISFPFEAGVLSPMPGETRTARHGRRRTRRVAMAAFLLAAAVVAAWWVTDSPLFDLKSLAITGNTHLPDRRIAALGGLERTTNVFWLSTGSISTRIEANPWVSHATVERTLPGSVVIAVTERSPVAVIAGRSLLVAGDGTVLGRTDRRGRLPLISAPRPGLAAGSRIRPGLPALTVARVLPTALRSFVVSISGGGDGLILTLRDGVKVWFGRAEDAVGKATALEAVLGWTGRRGVVPSVIDVRVSDAPALTPAPGSSVP